MYLEHANITVKSLEAAKSFLALAFPDFEERGRGYLHGDPKGGVWCHFGTDDTYVALQENSDHSPRQDTPYTHDGINHIGFVVEDLEALMSRLREAGYEPTDASALEGHPWRRRAYFIDDNAFEWEFVEYVSESAAERNDYSHG